MNSKILNIILIIIIFVLGGYVYSLKSNKEITTKTNLGGVSTTTEKVLSSEKSQADDYSDAKTYIFDNFHGSTNIDTKFKFLYPTAWYSDGQYFSPEKIEYYDLFTARAAVYFDLMKMDVFDQTEFKYQIDKSKRRSPDSVVKIDSANFKKFDLIDYGTYGGDSAGRVIVYVGPKIKIDGEVYFLVFHWEEKPLAKNIFGNNPEIFERMVLSLKFI